MSLSEVTVTRLTKLADFMDGLPAEAEKHFDMGFFVQHNGKSTIVGEHGIKAETALTREHLLECGMSACAFGWACFVPEFIEAGLTIGIDDDNTWKQNQGKAWPSYDGRTGNDAASTFFRLSYEDTEHLFGETQKITTPKEWAKHCREFLRNAGE